MRSNKHKRILKEADRIISLKEDIDMISWDRVLQIGKRLASPLSDDERNELSSELIGIAQSNIALAFRLGIDVSPSQGNVMASGIEVLEGGLAEKALIKEDEKEEKEEEMLGDDVDFDPEQPPVRDEPPRLTVRIEPTSQRRKRFSSNADASSVKVVDSRKAPVVKGALGRFRNLYESRDGSLSVFEDKDGHLVAVDSAKFA